MAAVTAVEEYKAGDVTLPELAALQDRTTPLTGRWEEIKEISDPTEEILGKMGVGFLKRKARAAAKVKTEISANGSKYTFKTFFPLKITKQVDFETTGEPYEIKDSDTCDWKATAILYDGKILQKRVGSKGVWYDTRMVLSSAPKGNHKGPILLIQWVLITPAGETLTSRTYCAQA